MSLNVKVIRINTLNVLKNDVVAIIISKRHLDGAPFVVTFAIALMLM